MRVYIYDFLNKNILASYEEKDVSVSFNESIDDFSSATITIPYIKDNLVLNGLENIYIEDNKEIIFGGVMVSLETQARQNTVIAYDHRWVFSKLVIDEDFSINSSESVLEKIQQLINIAKAKRQIPIDVSFPRSEIDTNIDVSFFAGESVGNCIAVILENTFSRWSVSYLKQRGIITGFIEIRPSARETNRSRILTTDSQRLKTLSYIEGNPISNIQEYNISYNFLNYSSRARVGVRINGQPQYFQFGTLDGTSQFFETQVGRFEEFVTDYNINSSASAQNVARINATQPKIEAVLVLNPDYIEKITIGERVQITIDNPIIRGLINSSVRVDRINYVRENGYWLRQVNVNFMTPQKRVGTTGLLEEITNLKKNLNQLNKDYFNN